MNRTKAWGGWPGGRSARTAKCWTTGRFRLSGRDEGPVADPSLSSTLDDVRAVAGVRLAARYGTQPAPGPLDLGASLVLLGNLRLHLDALEADLLDAATQLGMSWDLIAAIIGIPADDARRRLGNCASAPTPVSHRQVMTHKGPRHDLPGLNPPEGGSNSTHAAASGVGDCLATRRAGQGTCAVEHDMPRAPPGRAI